MRTSRVLVVMTLSLSLTALTSCRFGNRTVESNATPPADEFSKYEISYSNTPSQFAFCTYMPDPSTPTDTKSYQFCTAAVAADSSNTPSYVTKLLTDPIALHRYTSSSDQSTNWGLYDPTQNPVQSILKMQFDTNSGQLAYSGSVAPTTLWSASDPTCLVQTAYFITGTAQPDQKSLGLVFREYDLYSPECGPTLQKIANCLDGVTGACSASELTQWQNYFGPWLDSKIIGIDDIPHLNGSGYKVSFR